MEQLWASLDSHDLNLVQISHLTSLISAESEKRRWKTRTRLQDPVADAEAQRYSKFLYSLLMVTSSWVLLLFEEKLQRGVPLISGKAVGQLAVIQQMGNWAQTGKPSNPAVWPAQTRSNKTNWTFLEHLPFRLGLCFKRDVPACLALLSDSLSLAAQSWKLTSPVSRY